MTTEERFGKEGNEKADDMCWRNYINTSRTPRVHHLHDDTDDASTTDAQRWRCVSMSPWTSRHTGEKVR